MADTRKANPLVSVIIPVFNAEDWIKASINSILSQTWNALEIIVINDGSTDQTLQILQSYKDERVRIFSKKQNEGIVSALNKGLELADGNFLARMDADDTSNVDRFERQVRYFQNNENIDILATAVTRFSEDTGQETVINFPNISHTSIVWESLFFCPIAHPTVMVRWTPKIKQHFKYSDKYPFCEDYHLWLSLYKKAFRFHVINEPLVRLRKHHANTESKRAELQRKSALQCVSDFISSHIEDSKSSFRKLRDVSDIEGDDFHSCFDMLLVLESYIMKEIPNVNAEEVKILCTKRLCELVVLAQEKAPKVGAVLMKKILSRGMDALLLLQSLM